MNFAAIKTPNGHSMGEAASAFQKAIRRGEEDDALYFMNEMVDAGEHGFAGYVWKRIRIIMSEDIGPAEPLLPAVLHALKAAYDEGMKDQKTKEREAKAKGQTYNKNNGVLYLFHAVMLCCRARKNREANDAMLYFRLSPREETKREIPDYALDQHTARGRSMGRGIEHFLDEASKVNNETGVNAYVERVDKLMRKPARVSGSSNPRTERGLFG